MPALRPEHFGLTARYKEIKKLCDYFCGKQYDGRPDWWAGTDGSGKKVALRDRKPCVIYPLPKAAVQQVVRFTYGEGRFPTVTVKPSDEGSSLLGLTISDDQAEQLTQFVSDLIEASRLKSKARAAMAMGLSARTAVAFACLRNGRIEFELPQAQDCWPTFRDDHPGNEVTELVWSYQFDKLIDDPNRGPTYVRHWFRRDITETEFVVYKDVPVEPGKAPDWIRDNEKTQAHGFGFCPVIWTRNLMVDASSGDLDGVGLYEDLLCEFDALNFALSQRHRGVHYLGIPQPYETGVEEDDGPQADMVTSRRGYSAAGEQPLGQVTETARKMSPDEIWSYRGEKVSLGLLETTGKAFEVATNHVTDIRGRALEAMSVVLVNAADVASQEPGNREMSAKFLALAYAPLLALVDDLRQCWWPYSLEAMISMALRIVHALGGKGILIPRAAEIAKLLDSFYVTTDQGVIWLPPKMTPLWGDYFSPSNAEIKEGVETAATAKEKGLVQQATATKYVASYFDVQNVDSEVEELAAEAETKRQEALEDMQATAKTKSPEFGAGPKEPKP